MHTEESLNALTKAQLIEILENDYEAEVDKAASKGDLIASIMEFQAEESEPTVAVNEADGGIAMTDEQKVDEEAVAKAKAEAEAAAADVHGKQDPKFRIVIHEGEGVEGRLPVKLSVNGYAWEIKRGKEVVVPKRVVDALKNAVKTEITMTESGEYIERNVPRFAFSVEPA